MNRFNVGDIIFSSVFPVKSYRISETGFIYYVLIDVETDKRIVERVSNVDSEYLLLTPINELFKKFEEFYDERI